jgi:LuxR family transcriptional regulator, maltose regulon positive regulatory protein
MELLAAPAGYGKSTVLSQWAEADGREFAWITLDDRYNDPALLIGSIAAALDEIESVDEAVFAPLTAPRPDLRNVVVPRLCEALYDREQPELPLGRMRARRLLVELRAADLKMTPR